MGGGWFGYVFVFGACGLTVGLLAACTLLLYVVARVRGRADAPRVVVTSIAAPLSEDGAGPAE